MFLSPEQNGKAYKLMFVTLAGIVILVRLLQLSKTPSPRLVTPFPIVTLVRFLQPPNA